MTPFVSDFCAEHVEGGKYISPEFRLGQVYDGGTGEGGASVDDEHMLLYRPVYVRIADKDKPQATPRFSRDLSASEYPTTSSARTALNVVDNGAAVGETPTAPSSAPSVSARTSTTEVTVDLHQLNMNDHSKSHSTVDHSQRIPLLSNTGHEPPLYAEASSIS